MCMCREGGKGNEVGEGGRNMASTEFGDQRVEGVENGGIHCFDAYNLALD